MSNDDLGDRMKNYEMMEAGRKFLPLLPIVARLDGRSFSKFTKGLKRPYDIRLSNLMIDLTKYLVQETNAVCGYCQSDEISLAWYSSTRESQIFFDGRIQKMNSVLASMAGTYFMYQLAFNNALPKEYADKLPHFDCRVWQLPNLSEATNCFLFRELDATKNSISMAAQEFYSHNELMNKNSSEKQELLFQKGINWNYYPSFFKRGSFVQRVKTSRKFTEEELKNLPEKHLARKNLDLEIVRTDYSVIDMPPLNKVINRIDVIFNGATPITKEDETWRLDL